MIAIYGREFTRQYKIIETLCKTIKYREYEHIQFNGGNSNGQTRIQVVTTQTLQKHVTHTKHCNISHRDLLI